MLDCLSRMMLGKLASLKSSSAIGYRNIPRKAASSVRRHLAAFFCYLLLFWLFSLILVIVSLDFLGWMLFSRWIAVFPRAGFWLIT